MPSPKSGNAGSAVSPVSPAKAVDADKADPGDVEKVNAQQLQTKPGQYGSVKVKALKAPKTKLDRIKRRSWIEIVLLDDKKNPMAGEPYKVMLPDGQTLAEGSLDEKGFARVIWIEPGNCTVSFPSRDKSCWKKK